MNNISVIVILGVVPMKTMEINPLLESQLNPMSNFNFVKSLHVLIGCV